MGLMQPAKLCLDLHNVAIDFERLCSKFYPCAQRSRGRWQVGEI
jgi:hypothetical protein